MRVNTSVETQVDLPLPRSQRFAIRVFIYRAGVFCGTEVFSQPELMIGRNPRSDLKLVCETVSGAHAMVIADRRCLRIEDSGSRNGVRVNGEAVLDAELLDWDEVTIGTFVLRFQLIGAWRPDGKRRGLRTSLWWDPEREQTEEDETVFVPEPQAESMFPMAELLEPETTETQVLSEWARLNRRKRKGPMREVA